MTNRPTNHTVFKVSTVSRSDERCKDTINLPTWSRRLRANIEKDGKRITKVEKVTYGIGEPIRETIEEEK